MADHAERVPMPRRVVGFTVVELMVTVLVLAILLAVAVPSFRSTMRRGSVANAMNTISGDMQFARGQAASQHRFVSLCRSADGATCAVTSTSPYNYDVGWIVYSYDVTAAGANQVYSATSGNMDILRTQAALKGVSLRATDTAVITFNQTGGFVTTGATRTQLTFVACSRPKGSETVDSAAGTSDSGTQGTTMTLRASGSIIVNPLPVGSSCVP
ncbi:MAG: GspH/FimT family pseudopilin [Luteibacter sp.]|uniref:GspH/FimT family pseudopilin n=1 Tax=Luteibacter sp. TaxID=1886636 RepID=UPI002809D019|nr:GspH/FimT family pseudopilin [Luteibacter sp.]MDQ7996150.1 GspH/FimT family pseudopilin [Luteibacter sp.]MDQ8048845.1 GspH/FimT family pseudopilin [Luteibacter sp.]